MGVDLKKKLPNECVGCQFLIKSKEEIEHSKIQTKTWLTTDELVVYSGFSRAEIYRLRLHGTNCAGTLPYVKIKNSVMFRRTEIDKWMEKHAVGTTI
ncbi:helix-turn-helix domain-containing protein [Draconibacterium orientale]|uniref:helix-turn-helix domain-containing protein n=1 Tax=Draconibacterium orientale TaxID=1168034 RepID=UPI002ABE85A6|nr:helix-turn-helix domain-containing protein [Draconibacterium orientale]